MKIEHHYNFETKLTPCINTVIELIVTYLKHLKTALKHVTMRSVPSRQRDYTVSQKKHVNTFSTITLTIGVRLQ